MQTASKITLQTNIAGQLRNSYLPPNKRVQTGLAKRYALDSAADAGRYVLKHHIKELKTTQCQEEQNC